MADLSQFIIGTIGSDFNLLKTSDNVYLKDILKDFSSSLDLYNNRNLALTRILANKFTQDSSVGRKVYTDDEFQELGEVETPGMRNSVDVWKYPLPIKRIGALTQITREKLQTMSSGELTGMHNGKLEADQKAITKEFFQSAMKNTSLETRIDALDEYPASKKAFWNADGVNTPRSNGQITFTSSHTHYKAASGVGSDGANIVTNVIDNITEHLGMGGAQILLWVKSGESANTIKALDSFKGVFAGGDLLGMVNPSYAQTGQGQALIESSKQLGYNIKIIGTFKDAIVISTPDIPSKYILGTAYLGENSKDAPIGWREHSKFKGLFLLNPENGNPLIGKNSQYRRYLGQGVNNRSAGVVFYFGGSSWVEPTFI